MDDKGHISVIRAIPALVMPVIAALLKVKKVSLRIPG